MYVHDTEGTDEWASGEAELAVREADCHALVQRWDELWFGSVPGSSHGTREAYEHLYGRAPVSSPGDFVRPLFLFRSGVSLSPQDSVHLHADTLRGSTDGAADASVACFLPQNSPLLARASTRLSGSGLDASSEQSAGLASARETENGAWRQHIFYAPLSKALGADESPELSHASSLVPSALTPNSSAQATDVLGPELAQPGGSPEAAAHAARLQPHSVSIGAAAAASQRGASGSPGAASNGNVDDQLLLQPPSPANGRHRDDATPAQLGARPPAPPDGGGGGDDGSDGEDRARGAAWRYRFARRWKAEQQRVPNSSSGGLDPGNGFLSSFGEGLQLQMDTQNARASMTGSMASANMCEQLLYDDATAPESVGNSANGAQPMATHELVARAAAARQQRAQQQRLERQAKEWWRGANQQWVGSDIEPVVIDKVGEFNYVLFKLSDVKGRHQYCIRGGSRSSSARISEKLTLEVSELCYAKKLRPATVTPLGYGVMQWRRDKDRHLTLLSDGVQVYDSKYQVAEFLTLATAITQAGLPSSYKVSAA